MIATFCTFLSAWKNFKYAPNYVSYDIKHIYGSLELGGCILTSYPAAASWLFEVLEPWPYAWLTPSKQGQIEWCLYEVPEPHNIMIMFS